MSFGCLTPHFDKLRIEMSFLWKRQCLLCPFQTARRAFHSSLAAATWPAPQACWNSLGQAMGLLVSAILPVRGEGHHIGLHSLTQRLGSGGKYSHQSHTTLLYTHMQERTQERTQARR